MSRPTDIFVAVLGAGKASRFGADKLVQPLGGKPLGQWALEAAQGLGRPVIWIAGKAAPGFVTCEAALNPDAAEGIGTSVALAARLAHERGAEALLVTLADMPMVTTSLLRRLIDAGAPSACRYPEGHAGVPALIPASSFTPLMALTGDRGAGAVLTGLPDLVLLDCKVEELFDVDSPAALEQAAALIAPRG